MENRLFLLVLSLSISGTITAGLVFGLKALIGKKFSKNWQYYIWIVVMFRLLIPISAETNLIGHIFERSTVVEQVRRGSGQLHSEDTDKLEQADQKQQALQVPDNTAAGKPDIDTADKNTEGTAAAVPETAGQAKPESSTEQTGSGEQPKGLQTDEQTGTDRQRAHGARGSDRTLRERLLQNLWLIWMFGVILSLSVKIVDYRNFLRYLKLQNSSIEDEKILAVMDDVLTDLKIKKEIGLYSNDLAVSPMLIGGIHPCIILPKQSLQLDCLPYVLMHELTHYKRKDIWMKWLFQLTMCIHWFNPVLIWINRDINRCCELSCDETVLRVLAEEDRKEYGNVLLDIADIGIQYKNRVMSMTLVENKKNLKERLVGIMNYKKITKWAAVCSGLVLCFLLTVALTVGAMTMGEEKKEFIAGNTEAAVSGAAVNPNRPGGIYTPADLAKNDPWDWNDEEEETDEEEEYSDTENWWNWSNWSNWEDIGKEYKAKASRIYDDDTLIAGTDFSSGLSTRHYSHNSNGLTAGEMEFNGSNTLFIADVKQDVSMPVEFSADKVEGKFKVCLIGPDKKVTVVKEGAGSYSGNLVLKKGRNCLKYVAKNAVVTKVRINYEKVSASVLNGWYRSEGEELAKLFVDKVDKGNKPNLDEFVKIAPFMKESDVDRILIAALKDNKNMSSKTLGNIVPFTGSGFSRALSDYLKAGNSVTGEQLTAMAPFLEEEALEQFCKQIIDKSGTLKEEELVNLAPFVNEDYLSELLVNCMNQNKISSSSMTSLAPFVDEDIFSDYLTEGMKKGTYPTEDQIVDLAPFITSDCIGQFLKGVSEGKVKISDRKLTQLMPFADEDELSDYFMKQIKSGKSISRRLMNEYACFVDETVLGEYYKQLINKGGTVSEQELVNLAPYMDEDLVSDLLADSMKQGKISDSAVKNLAPYADEDIFSDYLIGMMKKGTYPSSSLIGTIAPYITSDCIGDYIKAASDGKVKLSETTLNQLIPYAEDDALSEYLMGLIKNNKLSKSMLGQYACYMDEDVVAEALFSLVTVSPKDALECLHSVYYAMDEEDIASVLKKIIKAGTKVSMNDIDELVWYLDSSDLEDILNLMVEKNMASQQDIKQYRWFFD